MLTGVLTFRLRSMKPIEARSLETWGPGRTPWRGLVCKYTQACQYFHHCTRGARYLCTTRGKQDRGQLRCGWGGGGRVSGEGFGQTRLSIARSTDFGARPRRARDGQSTWF